MYKRKRYRGIVGNSGQDQRGDFVGLGQHNELAKLASVRVCEVLCV